MKTLNVIAQVLIIVGAINWGLVAWFDFNLVSAIFGYDTLMTNIVYTLVGVAGLYGLYLIAIVSRSAALPNRDPLIVRDDPTHARH